MYNKIYCFVMEFFILNDSYKLYKIKIQYFQIFLIFFILYILLLYKFKYLLDKLKFNKSE